MSHDRNDRIAAFAHDHGLPERALAELRVLVEHEVQRRVPTATSGTPAGDPGLSSGGLTAGSRRPPTREADDTLIAGRYRDLGLLGEGAMGEVRRVYDAHLERTVAMKFVHPRLTLERRRITRFVAEAQATAQLQHPGIVPVYDLGLLDDGRAWFTMRQVSGPTLADAIGDAAWTVRRLVSAFVTVCDTVAYAHARGVIHRDLKPANIIVGEHGEVLVLDWGIAKVVTAADDGPEESVTTDWARSEGTAQGAVAGTPAYMAPEQARGGPIDARTDVFALGAMLHHLLAGVPPSGAPLPSSTPPELVAVCARATARDPAERFPTATALARAAEAWLDGVKRQEQALAQVARAGEAARAAADLGAQAAELAARGAERLTDVERWQPEEDKAEGWALQDEASAMSRMAALRELEAERGLHAALRIEPALPEAHATLLQRAMARHRTAEAARDLDGAAMSEVVAGEHAAALPEAHPARTAWAAYLRGDGALTVVTDPPGAEVRLFRYTLRNRRLVPEPLRSLGRTPLRAERLPMGRYLAVLAHPDRAEVQYPFEITRGEHWDGVPPDATEPHPVWLPSAADLAPDDVYVPAGWLHSGGDDEVIYPLPARRLWCDAVVIERFPVSTERYIAFLDDLVARGDEALAAQFAPRPNMGAVDQLGPPIFRRAADGTFHPPPEGAEGAWTLDLPIFMIDWFGAVAFAGWHAERTGEPWRLPGELEWEHGARGGDQRRWPWGDAFDHAWCVCRDGHRGQRGIRPITSHPVDCSPYGLRGLAGNMRDWCAEVFAEAGPEVAGRRILRPPDPEPRPGLRVARGGSWSDNIAHRIAFRCGHDSQSRNPFVSFRLARSIGDPAGP